MWHRETSVQNGCPTPDSCIRTTQVVENAAPSGRARILKFCQSRHHLNPCINMRISHDIKCYIKSWQEQPLATKVYWWVQLILKPFNGLFSRTTWVSQYQNGKTGLDLNDFTRSGFKWCKTWWGLGMQWHQLDHMHTICTTLQTDNHTNNTSSLNFYRLNALPDAQPTALKYWRYLLMSTNKKLIKSFTKTAFLSHHVWDLARELQVTKYTKQTQCLSCTFVMPGHSSRFLSRQSRADLL